MIVHKLINTSNTIFWLLWYQWVFLNTSFFDGILSIIATKVWQSSNLNAAASFKEIQHEEGKCIGNELRKIAGKIVEYPASPSKVTLFQNYNGILIDVFHYLLPTPVANGYRFNDIVKYCAIFSLLLLASSSGKLGNTPS